MDRRERRSRARRRDLGREGALGLDRRPVLVGLQQPQFEPPPHRLPPAAPSTRFQTELTTLLEPRRPKRELGHLTEFPIERMFRDAKLTEIGEAIAEVQRMVIAHELLRFRRRRVSP